VSTLSENSFDPRNQYAGVLKAVREAASSKDVKVYRVETDGGASRVEYWVLALYVDGGKIVGVRAKAVET
jgi:hypothetical protein